MPAFLRKSNYQDVTDGKSTVFQPAYRTDLDTYTWFSQNPEHRVALIRYMGLEEKVRGRWLDEAPFERDTRHWDAGRPVFVDVGGNVGHYCAKFKERFPGVPGRVVLQDLPGTLAHALQTPGVEPLAHDFFEPQPIKGTFVDFPRRNCMTCLVADIINVNCRRRKVLPPRLGPPQLE